MSKLTGKMIVFDRGGNWWTYDPETNTTFDLVRPMPHDYVVSTEKRYIAFGEIHVVYVVIPKPTGQYPEHEKSEAIIPHDRELLDRFLTWGGSEGFIDTFGPNEKCIDAFFGVDRKKLEQERKDMIAAQKSAVDEAMS